MLVARRTLLPPIHRLLSSHNISLGMVLSWLVVAGLSLWCVSLSPLLALLVAALGAAALGWDHARKFQHSFMSFDSVGQFYQIVPRSARTDLFWHWLVVGVIGVNFLWYFVKDQPFPAGMVVLFVILVLRWRFTGTFLQASPLNFPIFLLAAMTTLSCVVFSVNPGATLPKFYGLLFGLLFYFEAAYGVQLPGNLVYWVLVLYGFGLLIAGLGLLGIGEFPDELFNLSQLRQIMPHATLVLPRTPGGLHPNLVSGVLIFLLPLFALFWRSDIFRGLPYARLFRWLASATFLITAVLLLLAQSRGALSACVIIAVALYFALRKQYRRAALVVAGSLLILILLFFFGYFEKLALLLGVQRSPAVNLSSFTWRELFWKLGFTMIKAFPLKGIGTGAFDYVALTMYRKQYPGWILNTPGNWFPHVHNTWLQVAIDLGIPGFIAYVALLSVTAWIAWRAFVLAHDMDGISTAQVQRLILGLAAGLLAHQFFGLTDVVYLGAKPGIIMWIILGILTGVYLRSQTAQRSVLAAASKSP